MHEKALSTQEKEVVQDLEKELAELEAEDEVLASQIRQIRGRKNDIIRQLAEIKSPFAVGDIVVDEEDVKYRVTKVTASSRRPAGIRLSKNGAEAHKDPRTIWSNKLELVK